MVHQENIFFSMNKELNWIELNWKFQAGKMDHWSFSFQKLIQMLKLKKKNHEKMTGQAFKKCRLIKIWLQPVE